MVDATSRYPVRRAIHPELISRPSFNEALNPSFLGRLLVMGHSAVKGGQVAQAPAGQLLDAFKKFDVEGVISSGRSLGGIGLQYAGKAAGFAGGLSLLINGYRVLTHSLTVPDAGSRVVGDAVGGAVGGLAGSIAGGLGLTILGGLGLAGAPLAIGAALVGMVGFHLAERGFRKTGLFQAITSTTHDLLGGMTRYSMGGGRPLAYRSESPLYGAARAG